MRPIDANAFDKRISFVCQSCSGGICEYCKLGELQSILSDMPTLEPEVRHGRWLPHGDDMWICSNCKENIIFSMHESDRTEKQRYCCRCGTRMDGKEGEQDE